MKYFRDLNDEPDFGVDDEMNALLSGALIQLESMEAEES